MGCLGALVMLVVLVVLVAADAQTRMAALVLACLIAIGSFMVRGRVGRWLTIFIGALVVLVVLRL